MTLDIKSGETDIKNLISSAKKNGDTISISENGFTKDDMKLITKKAKEMGIPIAFTGKKNKDNIYANVRTKDLPIFQRICTDIMKEKVSLNPQQLSNFKVKEWEMPFITNELNKHDLAASFGKTENGEHFCLFNKSDEKAILIARGEFVRKCNELNKEMSFDKDEEGNYTIKDLHTGREVTFDSSMTREELSSTIQETFEYDENKTNIACTKFGEEMLEGEEKQKYFSNNPQNEFSKIDTNIKVEGESILAHDYTCWRLTPKSDKVSKIVFRDEDGNFAVLDPNRMSEKQMSEALKSQLHINNKDTINALIDKAEKVHDYYSKQDQKNLSHDYKFTNDDFVNGGDYILNDTIYNTLGGKVEQELPLSEINNKIERNSKKEFTVNSTVKMVGIDENDEHYTRNDTQTIRLSFSDKKNSIRQLKEMYQKQGVPENIAKEMAKDVFTKAKAQSAGKVLHIEEVKTDSITIGYGWQVAEFNISDRDNAIEKIGRKFGISDEEAGFVLDKAIEKIEKAEQENLVDNSETDNEKSEQTEEEKKSEINESKENKNNQPEKEKSSHVNQTHETGELIGRDMNINDNQQPEINTGGGMRRK